MATIVGIVASLAGPAIELSRWMATPIKRQFNYLFCLRSNVQNLKDEAKRLEDAKSTLDAKVACEKNNAQVIVSGVVTWLAEVNHVQDKMKDIEYKISNVQSGCLAVKSRFLLSKKAKKTAEAMKELRDGCNFDPLSMPPPPLASTAPTIVGHVHEFASRKEIEANVLEALKERKVSIVGICGMGGVGKTTLAKKLMCTVINENLFEEVLMVHVGQQIDMLDIQQQIADSFGFSLGVETLQARAHRLRARLTNNKKILLVVDNVWDTLEWDHLGISCVNGITTCKILLTSWSRNVLIQMDAEVFQLQILNDEEAWSLFKGNTGTCVDEPILHSIAEQVMKECKGLPLALVTLGSALKNEVRAAIWDDNLRQLRDSDLKNMPNLHKEVYIPLRLSYEHLENQDMKCLFLFCSLFPEGYNIDLHYLTMHFIGLRIFGEKITSLKQTRDRILTLFENLKSRSLLLDGWDKNFVRMHDVVRDVAKVIASEKCSVDANLKSQSGSDCSWMMIFPETYKELQEHLVTSTYQRLNLLAIHYIKEWGKTLQIDKVTSFSGMEDLKSLCLERISFESLTQRLQVLKNLRSLNLVKCHLDCISIVGELLRLEIFVCRHCNEIKELPIEIGRLKRLKLLDFKGCSNLRKIAPGVLSNLIELEELKLWRTFTQWESININCEERNNASLNELEFLTKLTLLCIEIGDVSLVKDQINLPSSIVRYKIRIGEWKWIKHHMYEKTLIINGLPQDINCANWVNQLVRKTETFKIRGCYPRNFEISQLHSNIKFLGIASCQTVETLIHESTIPTLSDLFPILEHLELIQLPNLKEMYVGQLSEGSIPFKKLTKLNLQELPALTRLWKIPNQSISLNNLSTIHILGCHKLKNLFFLERGRDVFLQLKSLIIKNCDMMEEVFYSDENENDGLNSSAIVFPKLETLELDRLPSLTTFGTGIEYFEFPLVTRICILGCPKLVSVQSNLNPSDESVQLFNDKKVAFGSLKALAIKESKSCNIWCSQTSNYSSFRELENLKIFGCSNIKSVCASSMIEDFVNLKHLHVENCEDMKNVIVCEDSLEHNHPKIQEICNITISEGFDAFKNLEALTLVNMPTLKHLWNSSDQQISLSTLSNLTIIECHKLRDLFWWKMPVDLVLQLKWLTIKSCEMLEHVFCNDENVNSGHLTFKGLKKLKFQKLTSLVTLCQRVGSIANF